jgi:hypothetical protein
MAEPTANMKADLLLFKMLVYQRCDFMKSDDESYTLVQPHYAIISIPFDAQQDTHGLARYPGLRAE